MHKTPNPKQKNLKNSSKSNTEYKSKENYIIKNIENSFSLFSNDDPDITSENEQKNVFSQKYETYERHSFALRSARYSKDTDIRCSLANGTSCLIRAWLLFIVIVISCNIHKLSDAVLITLLGTTTLNVLGLAFIVFKGYFKEMNQNTYLGRDKSWGKYDS